LSTPHFNIHTASSPIRFPAVPEKTERMAKTPYIIGISVRGRRNEKPQSHNLRTVFKK
jgi:hypothetical protein